jgi:hypothetical protein
MTSKIEADIRFLKHYAAVMTLVCVALVASAFVTPQRTQKFDQIDVERINIVEPDGKLRMVISNQAHQHPGIVNGKIIPRDAARPPGIIFFDQLGDEMGGLIYGENGGKGHFGSLTFDKVHGDQTIGFRHLEGDNGRYSSAVEMWQQPDESGDVLQEKYRVVNAMTDSAAKQHAIQALRDSDQIATQRLFLGKSRDNTVSLVLSDIKGRPRIRLSVPADGAARIEMLDESGKLVPIASKP